MPKKDINAGFAKPSMQSAKKHTAAGATTALLFGSGFRMDQEPSVPTQEIPLDKISLREINKFHPVNDLELDESIIQYGLINPIAVCHHIDEDKYIISAGERRYKSYCRLHERFPDSKRYETIECRVYILTEDKHLLEKGLPYISEEIEEGIYRDSNMLSRQLTDEDIACQIRHVVDRFYDIEYLDKLREEAKKVGITTYSNPNLHALISTVMSSQNMWSREKMRQYLVVYNAKREDLLAKIENGEMAVNTAYKTVVAEQGLTRKRRKTNHIPRLVIDTDKVVKDVNENHLELSTTDRSSLHRCIKKLQSILGEDEDEQSEE